MLTCDACGTQNPSGAQFCASCRSYLAWTEPEADPPADVAVETEPPADESALEDTMPGRRLRADRTGADVPAYASTESAGDDAPARRAAEPPDAEAPDDGPEATAAGSVRPERDLSALEALFRPAEPMAAGSLGPRSTGPQALGSQALGAGWSAAGGTAVTTVLPPAGAQPRATAPVILPQHGPCPVCSRVNDGHLRFCAKCGHGLVVTASSGPRIRPQQLTWWQRVFDSKERAARRAYRHSLPTLYRWRRVIVAVVLVSLAGVFLLASDRHPKQFVVARYYDLRNTLVNVSLTQARVIPTSASVRGSRPDALIDRTEEAMAFRWRKVPVSAPCQGGDANAVVEVTMPASRVRQVVFRAGLLADDPDRPRQYRPKAVGVSFDGGKCHPFTLADNPGRQPFNVDSEVPVTTAVITFDAVFDAPPEGEQVLSLTEFTVKERPPT